MKAETQRRPNFFVLGAARCGTSSLCDYLARHPDVFIPEIKEPVFFDAEYERGLEFYWNKYFSDWSGQAAVGEGRVFLLFLPFVPGRIKASLPDARLIAILRNPVERAYSHWWHRFTSRNETLSFEEALEKNLERIEQGIDFEGEDGPKVWRKGLVHRGAMASRFRLYLDMGLYARQLQRYYALFPEEQLRVVFYDDLKEDAASLVRQLWEFLGVSPDGDLSDLSARNVASAGMRNRWKWRAQRLLRASGLREWVPKSAKDAVRGLFREEEVERPPMERETRLRLIEYYRGPNAELEALVGRDLSAWSRAEEG